MAARGDLCEIGEVLQVQRLCLKRVNLKSESSMK
jgi:hypothetical protein